MTQRRHLINTTDAFVPEALEGFGIAHEGLVAVNLERRLITRRTFTPDKVGLVSGGGSGHEPLHGGFVGVGMLDVAVAGAVFASPTAVQIHEGTTLAHTGTGVLHIVKNYTGDVINFGLAADLADDDAIPVATVIVDDDLATDGVDGGPGRRGTAAVIAVEKMCGAAAERGASLADLQQLGERIVSRSRTLGIALEAGTLPGRTDPSFELAATEVEFGVGIHGERGRGQIAFAPADDLIASVVTPLLDSLPVNRGSEVLVIVNGLGATYPLELQVAARRVAHLLSDRGIRAARWLVGPYVTSLDMRGLSVTLTALDQQLTDLWDDPVRTPALTW
jgi:dihydroxyacetone kinase-like protein